MNELREQQDAVFSKLESLDSNSNVSVVTVPENFEEDNRICLSLVYFLSDNLKRKIKELVKELRTADSRQYYYSFDSLHITIQGIRTIAYPPNFTEKDIKIVMELSEFMKGINLSFEIKSLFLMSGSLSIKCFPTQETQDFVLSLRKKLEEIGVPDNKRYVNNIVIGNITICRFYNQPNQEFLRIVDKFKSIHIGDARVDKISLISTNAVAFKEKTTILKEFY